MAIKLADTAKPMGDFPVAEGVDIEVKVGEKTESLQEAIENGDIGGGGTGKKVIDDEAVGNDTTWSSQKMDSTFLKKDGESSNTTVTFTEPEEETEPQSKDKLSVLVGKFVKKFKNLTGSIGDLTKLKTDEKTNIVGAVNEISDSLVDLESMIDNVYTEEEKVVGKWIDGRPIYRKVVDGLNVNITNKWVDVENIPNIDIVTKLVVWGKYVNSGAPLIVSPCAIVDNNTVKANSLSLSAIANKAIIEYTKTTD